MKFLVFGAGALGSLVGGVLSGRHDVVLVGRREHVKAVNSGGLVIEGMTELRATPRAFERIPRDDFEFVFVTVKSYDTPNAAGAISRALGSGVPVISLQNGLGNVEELARVFDTVMGGTTSHGVLFLGPGRVRHTGLGDTVIGDFKGADQALVGEAARALTASGMKTRTTDNIVGELWAKAVSNASINPLTALMGFKNGRLLESKALEEVMTGACREAVEVARKSGVGLPDYDLVERTRDIVRMTAENRSSMLQDMDSSRRTEIDSITGRFVELGRKNGVPTPVNFVLYALVKGLEASKAPRAGAIKN